MRRDSCWPLAEEVDEERRADDGGHSTNRHFPVGATTVRARVSANYDGNGAADGGGWQQSAMIGAKHEAHRVRHEQAT